MKFLPQLEEIQERGYNATKHWITSEDGYISRVIRISGSLLSPSSLGKDSVLVFNGLGAGSANFIVQPRSRNLAFTLADAGYEVWLADWRGTTPSMNHTYLDPNKDISFWNYTFEDVGVKDLPVFFNLILKEAEKEANYFACHSTGCAMWLAGLAQVPELNGRFKAGFLMAPAAHLGTSYNPLVIFYSLIFETPLEDLIFEWGK